jgi:hypothetical protein
MPSHCVSRTAAVNWLGLQAELTATTGAPIRSASPSLGPMVPTASLIDDRGVIEVEHLSKRYAIACSS